MIYTSPQWFWYFLYHQVKAPSSDSSNELYNMASDSMSSTAPGISVDETSTEEHESEYTSHALALLAEVTVRVNSAGRGNCKSKPVLARVTVRVNLC